MIPLRVRCQMSDQIKKHDRVVDILPDLAAELQRLLMQDGQQDLAAQVADLRIVERCRCGDDFCATFYVQMEPRGSWGPTHRNLPLTPNAGMIILDIVNERIACVEVLYRDDVRKKLLAALP